MSKRPTSKGPTFPRVGSQNVVFLAVWRHVSVADTRLRSGNVSTFRVGTAVKHMFSM